MKFMFETVLVEEWESFEKAAISGDPHEQNENNGENLRKKKNQT